MSACQQRADTSLAACGSSESIVDGARRQTHTTGTNTNATLNTGGWDTCVWHGGWRTEYRERGTWQEVGARVIRERAREGRAGAPCSPVRTPARYHSSRPCLGPQREAGAQHKPTSGVACSQRRPSSVRLFAPNAVRRIASVGGSAALRWDGACSNTRSSFVLIAVWHDSRAPRF